MLLSGLLKGASIARRAGRLKRPNHIARQTGEFFKPPWSISILTVFAAISIWDNPKNDHKFEKCPKMTTPVLQAKVGR